MKKRSYRRRRTVQTEPIAAQTLGMTPAMLAEALKLMGFQGPAPVVTQPTPTQAIPPANRARKVYQAVTHPQPPFGDTTMAVYHWLKTKGAATQAQLEAGSGLSEGQIKGALRQLALAGYISSERES